MTSLLKELYSRDFFYDLTQILHDVLPDFDKKEFIHQIFTENWQDLALKQRMKHTSTVLHSFFSSDFIETTTQIKEIIRLIQQKETSQNTLPYLFFPDYIETHGINDFNTSIKAIEFITPFISCEFAVRPFIKKYNSQMIAQMQQWSLHKNHHVRRLSSEGSRPRLPWAMALPELKKNPTPILPILENLKTDSSEYVRRSVANSLNDIAKDNPVIVISFAKKWKGISKETDAIIKHGARTLLKQGNTEILTYYGLLDNPKLVVSDFILAKNIIKIGEHLSFSFSIQNNSLQKEKIRLEYAIYYLRLNGQHSKKVFKITEKTLKPTETLKIERKQSFKIITTRKFYAGKQKIALILNGQEKVVLDFELVK